MDRTSLIALHQRCKVLIFVFSWVVRWYMLAMGSVGKSENCDSVVAIVGWIVTWAITKAWQRIKQRRARATR